VEALSVIGTPSDADTVIDLFSDPEPIVRAHAVRTAGTLSSSRITEALQPLLSDAAWIVRSAASEVLGKPTVDTATA